MADDIQYEGAEQAAPPSYNQPAPSAQGSGLIRFVLATHIVASERAANYLLIGIAALLIALSIYIVLPGGGVSQADLNASMQQMRAQISSPPPTVTQ